MQQRILIQSHFRHQQGLCQNGKIRVARLLNGVESLFQLRGLFGVQQPEQSFLWLRPQTVCQPSAAPFRFTRRIVTSYGLYPPEITNSRL